MFENELRRSAQNRNLCEGRRRAKDRDAPNKSAMKEAVKRRV